MATDERKSDCEGCMTGWPEAHPDDVDLLRYWGVDETVSVPMLRALAQQQRERIFLRRAERRSRS